MGSNSGISGNVILLDEFGCSLLMPLGRGGTGGTLWSSVRSPVDDSDATRSRVEMSVEWMLDASLPPLFLFALPVCREDTAEVMLVAVYNDVESLEAVAGMLE